MSKLIVCLPFDRPGLTTAYAYAQTRDGGLSLDTHGTAVASALPTAGVDKELVAIVPIRALSWHTVELPKGVPASKLRAVLDGLLEDHLLDDTNQLHFAIAPTATGSSRLVAACDKGWLHAALAPLETAGRPVMRLVPEYQPLITGEEDSTLYVQSDEGQALAVRRQLSAISLLPLAALPPDPTAQVLADPSVAARAQEHLGTNVELWSPAQRWLKASQSNWELAQFEFANSGRTGKKITAFFSTLWHAPRWRAARWGVALLLLANLVGLNAWARAQNNKLMQQRQELNKILQTTFPQVQLVVDAPVQMARELALLQQSAGAGSSQDLESMSSTVGTQLTMGITIQQLVYTDGNLRLKSPDWKTDNFATLQERLDKSGLQASLDGDTVLIKTKGQP